MTKKKIYATLLLSVTLLVGACSKKEEATTNSSSQQTTLSSNTSQVSSSQKSSDSASSAAAETDLSASRDEGTTTETSASLSQDEEEVTTETEGVVAQTATAATFNGSYYSVQGKYGEVIIVNKKHGLVSSYGYGEDPTALAAFQSLLAEMRAQGFSVSDAYSGFRSYDTQAGLYSNYVARDGQAAADRYSARPGYSEHQTGLAFDIIDGNGNLLEEPVASQWLLDNAHNYGFVVRYLSGKEHITGYMAEPWHLRYIGAEATDIAQSGLTLEEYYGVPGGNYTN